MDDHLAKPFRLDGLRSVLDRWLKSGQGSEARIPDAGEPAEQRSIGETARSDAAPTPVVDSAALERIASLQRPGRPDVLAKVVHGFFQSTPMLLDTLANAVAEDSFGEVREIAHSLKSSSANLGAAHLSQQFRELERSAANRDLNDARLAVQNILDEYILVHDWLATYLGETRRIESDAGAMVPNNG